MAPGARRSGPQKGGKKGDVYRIGGVDLPWDPDLELDAPQPAPLQPAFESEPPQPLSRKEKSAVAHFLKIRNNIRKGPLYTTLGDSTRITKPGQPKATVASTFDAFNGMPSYSSRYAPKKHTLPQLHTRPFVKKFFPKELWSTIDPHHREDDDEAGGVKNSTKGKSLQIPGFKNAEDVGIFDNELDHDEGGDGAVKDPEDEDAVEEDMDEEYDEDDEGGDYNAEQYFDDGGDDGDDYDAGDDGGVDYY